LFIGQEIEIELINDKIIGKIININKDQIIEVELQDKTVIYIPLDRGLPKQIISIKTIQVKPKPKPTAQEEEIDDGLLNVIEEKIYARNCFVKEIDDNNFCDENSLYNVNSEIKLGLFHNNVLVSIMYFERNNDAYYLSLFCSKLNIIVNGGFSKLLKFFVNNYKPKIIISFVDKCYTCGNIYEKLNFKLIENIKSDFKYIINDKRINSNEELKYPKIYDCGKLKYSLIL
jgi:hypothetical protein